MAEIVHQDFEVRLRAFVALVQGIVDAHFARSYENLNPPRFSVDPKGRKFAKIVRADVDGSSRSVHSFVDKTSGDVFKPAGWSAPAKHARGNVFADDGGASAVTPEGFIRYMS